MSNIQVAEINISIIADSEETVFISIKEKYLIYNKFISFQMRRVIY